MEISVKKLKFWSKIEISANIEILLKNQNLGQKSKFCSKIEILIKNRNFRQKLFFFLKPPREILISVLLTLLVVRRMTIYCAWLYQLN